MLNQTDLIPFTKVAGIMLLIDIVYLQGITAYFNRIVKSIQGKPISINVMGAVLSYITMAFALYYFVLRENRSVIDAAILGLCVYGVFDFTNKALFNNWDWFTVVIDMLWGSILFGVVAKFYYLLN